MDTTKNIFENKFDKAETLESINIFHSYIFKHYPLFLHW